MKERGFGKGLTIITAIILFAIVIASAVLTVVIKSANNGNVVNDLSNVNPKEELLYEPAYIDTAYGAGEVTGKIYIRGQGNDTNVYDDGYCLNHGGVLNYLYDNGRTWLNHTGSAYSSNNASSSINKNKIAWLLDNIVRTNAPQDELDYYTANLISIVAERGYPSSSNIVNDIINSEGYKAIYQIQQYAIWNYTNNERNIDLSGDVLFPGDANKRALYDSLLYVTDQNPNYAGEGDDNVTINISNAKMSQSGNDVWVGPITINNSIAKRYKISCDNLRFDGTTKSVAIYKSDRSTPISNNSFIDYKGDIYIKISNCDISTGTHTVTGVVDTKTYKTYALHWEYPDCQDVVTMSRQPAGDTKELNVKYENLTGEYQLNIEKVDENNTPVDINNNTFQAKIVKNVAGKDANRATALTANVSGTQIPMDGTVNDNSNRNRKTFNKVEITQQGYDAILINEESAPDGYVKYNKPILIYISKGANGGKLQGDVVKDYVYINGRKQTAKKVEGGYEYDGGNVHIAFLNSSIYVKIKNKKITGDYNLRILKTNGQSGIRMQGGNGKFDIKLVEDIANLNEESKLNGVIPSNATREEFYAGVGGNITYSKTNTITKEGYDAIIIDENDAPAGYAKYGKQIIIYVKKQRNTDKYAADVKKDKVYIGGTLQTMTETDEGLSYDNGNIIINFYNNNISVVVKNNRIDLALKKSINSVTDAQTGIQKYVSIENGFNVSRKFDESGISGIADKGDRGIDVTPLKNNTSTNALYYMNKTPVEVNKGDTIQYAIKVYNEGQVAAKAKEIVDYIPVGLHVEGVQFCSYGENVEVISERTSGDKYYTYDEEHGVLRIVNNNGNCIPAFDGNNLAHDTYYVICSVDNNANGVLTNVSEITKYAYKDGVGNVLDTTKDIDSVQDNWNTPNHDDHNPNTDKSTEAWRNYANNKNDYLDGEWHKEFIGQQNVKNSDDDDFDKVIVKEPFNFSIKKLVNNQNTDDIKFNITRKDKNGTETFENVSTVDATIGYQESIPYGYDGFIDYEIAEVHNDNYIQLPGSITVETQFDNGKISDVTLIDNASQKYIALVWDAYDSGIETVTSTVKNNGVDIDITTTVDFINSTVSIQINNKTVTPSPYSIRLKKISSEDGSILPGVTFAGTKKIGSQAEENFELITDSRTGITPVIESNIDFDNIGVNDTYKITEINLGSNSGYTKLNKEIDVEVSKTVNNGVAVVKDCKITCDGHEILLNKENSSDNFNVVQDGVNFNISAEFDVIDGNLRNLTITVPNAPDQPLPLVIKKVNKVTNEQLTGAEIEVRNFTTNNVLPTVVDNNGTISYTDSVGASASNITYKIVELSAPALYDNVFEGKYIKATVALTNGVATGVTTEVYNNDNTIDSDLSSEVEGTVTAGTVSIILKDPRTNKPIDLALKKVIVAVNGNPVDSSKGNYDRLTEADDKVKVDPTPLRNGGVDAIYNLNKTPIVVSKGDTIKYQIRIYNEGSEIDATASKIKDYIPYGLEVRNVYYRNNNEPLERGTDYEYDSIGNILTVNALDDKFIAKYDNGDTVSFDYITVECLVKDTAEGLQTNIAEITEYKSKDIDGLIKIETSDRDSQPANWRNPVDNNTANNSRVNRDNYKWRNYAGKSGNVISEGQFKNYVGQQDDDDFEKILVGDIDLVLKKVITYINDDSVLNQEEKYQRFQNQKINVNTEAMNAYKDVTTAYYYMNKTPIKVNINDKVTYQIRIYNEGDIDAVAGEIKDYIPKGLTFNSVSYRGHALTSGYSINDENVLTITALDGKLVQKYNGVEPRFEYVTVTCTVNGAVRGLLTNVAEISKYQTTWGYTNVDRDSQTTGNGEWQPNNGANKNTLDGKSGAQWARYYETGSTGKFVDYPYQQDDDDFEKIIVANSYTLKLRKISNDSDEIMDGVEFKVNGTTYTTGSDGYISIPDEFELSGEGGLDSFHIEEVATKDNYARLSIDKDGYSKGSDFYFYVRKMPNGDGSVSLNGISINFKDSRPDFPFAYVSSLPYGQVTVYTTDIDGNDVPVNIKKTENNDGKIEITITIGNNKRNFDLSLRKYIIKAGEKDIDRWGEPAIDVSNLVDDDETTTTAVYNNAKDPIGVYVKDKVLYGIKVYNEGNVDGFAELVMDDVPEGVEMIAPEESEVNTLYRWKMYRPVGNNEAVDASEVINYNHNSYVRTYNASEATVIVTDYLSKANGEESMSHEHPGEINSNLIRAFNGLAMSEPDGREIRVEFKVKTTAKEGEVIINKAQITEDLDKDGNPVTDIDSTPNVWEETPRDDDQDIEKIVVIRDREFDLSLRKFIAKVNGKELDNSREPVVDCSKLVNRTSTTAKYTHSKEPVLVNPKDVVEYTIRVYNEGEVDGYANLVMDDIPEGVQMIAPDYTPDGTANNFNAEYRWVMYRKVREGEDVSEKETISYDGKVYVTADNAEEAEVIVTDYLSQTFGGEANLLEAFDPAVGEMTEANYRDIKVQFMVKDLVDPKKEAGKLITNYAQITDDSDSYGNPVIDRDSTPNVWEETPRNDDQDYDVVRVGYFDLALYKWVTKAIVTEGGKTTEYESGHTQGDKSNVVNVTIPQDKLKETVVKFSYQVKVENEGTIPGYAKELKDHIPEGLKFVAEDNTEFGWVEQEDGTITTDYLKDTLLNPGDTAEVTVVLTWINGSDNLGKKVNFAEISKDYNDHGWPDIDSTPNNFKDTPKEDDEDEDEVLLQIRTGAKNIAIIITSIAAMVIVAGGAVCVKKFVVNK